MSEMQQGAWTKPAAMAIPKADSPRIRWNRADTARLPKTPACYGFSIVAKVIPGREEAFYEHGKKMEKR